MRTPQISRRGLLAAGAAAVAAPLVSSSPGRADVAAADVAAKHPWHNAEIVGGGFVPGIVFNTGERDLVYARTDIGGA